MTAITIGIPCHGDVKLETAMSLILACCCLREKHGYDIHLSSRRGPYVGWNRDQIVEDAVNAGTDWLMMIDTDIVFPPDAIPTLISRDKDIVGGFYMMKTREPMNTIKMGAFDPVAQEYTEAVKDWVPPPEPFRCAAVATGFLLIRMNAIKELPRPLFPTVAPVGEDVAFCQQADQAGLEVWCDPTFPIQHIGDYHY